MANTVEQFNADAGLKYTLDTSDEIRVGSPSAYGVGRWAYQIQCGDWTGNSIAFKAKIRGASDGESYAAGGPERRTLAGTDVAGGVAVTSDSAGVVICDQFDLWLVPTIGGDPVTVYLRPMEG